MFADDLLFRTAAERRLPSAIIGRKSDRLTPELLEPLR
jgi:hypothetical protein